MSEIKDIPEHWEIIKLGDLCDKISNGANVKQSDDKIGFPISRIETIWNETIDLNRVKYIAENNAEFIEKYALKRDDILFSHINSDLHLGKTAVYKDRPEILIHGVNVLLIRLKKDVSTDFLNYQFKLKRSRGEFVKIAHKSVNQSSINQSKLKNVDFIVPPLSEQLAIVSKIEELLSELDNGKQQLQTALQQLKVYRQSLLKWAFEGKLTHSNLKEGELPDGWKWVKFGEIFYGTPQNGLYKPSKDYGSGTPILRIDGFYSGIITHDYDYKRVRISKEEIQKYQLSINDIVVNRVNSMSHLGKCGLVKYLKEQTVFESNVMKVQIKNDLALPSFITSYLASLRGIKELTKNAKHAVNQASINQTDVANSLIPLPSLEEQQLIVDELESKLTICDNVEETIKLSLQQAETLRQSILKKTFEGKLV